jgi:hypothetical protein
MNFKEKAWESIKVDLNIWKSCEIQWSPVKSGGPLDFTGLHRTSLEKIKETFMFTCKSMQFRMFVALSHRTSDKFIEVFQWSSVAHRTSPDFTGLHRTSLDFTRFSWISIDFDCFLWFSLLPYDLIDFHVFSKILMSFDWFRLILSFSQFFLRFPLIFLFFINFAWFSLIYLICIVIFLEYRPPLRLL